MQNNFKIWLLGFLVTFGCVPAAYTQVTFEPEMLVLSLNQGQSQFAKVVVHNDSREAKDVEVTLNCRQGGKFSGDIDAWCTVQPKTFRLAAGGAQTVQMVFKGIIALPGECVLSLFAGEKLDTPIPLSVRVGMPIFIRFNGEKRAQGEILSVEPVSLPGTPLQVRVQVRNQGALHLAPFGLVWVEDAGHQRVWQADIRCDQPVFPGESLALNTTGPSPVWQGAGELHVQMFWGTLYGNQAVGVPTSSAKQVPLPAARMN